MILSFRRTAEHTRAEWMEESPSRLYSILRAYYSNLDVYDDVQAALWERGIGRDVRALRNPANRTVEFYASKLWPGTLPEALPIVTENERIVEPIERVWKWSNWGMQKQVAARQMAIYGDLFIKVSQTEDRSRVNFEVIKPEYVVDFDTDLRGYVTYARIDVPINVREGDKLVEHTHVEVWDKELYRRWEIRGTASSEVGSLGTPSEEIPIRQWGLDFVPLVHAKFRDVGDLRGHGSFTHALDKIDEANRQSTRLHQMLFRHNKPTWALSAIGQDAAGRPLPPPVMKGTDGVVSATSVKISDEEFVSLPGNSTLLSMVPDVNYADALAVLQDMMAEIGRDLPELAYYQLREMNTISGVAVRTLLSDAIDRLLEARGNAEGGLVRANQMALTIGAHAGLFADLGGTYESGDFDHSFEERDVISLTEDEQARVERQESDTRLVRMQVGISQRQALEELGYDAEDIERMVVERETEAAANLEAAATAFDRGAGL